jgi:hypothetical protein
MKMGGFDNTSDDDDDDDKTHLTRSCSILGGSKLWHHLPHSCRWRHLLSKYSEVTLYSIARDEFIILSYKSSLVSGLARAS